MSSGVQVKRAARPTIRANSSTQRTAIGKSPGHANVKRPRVTLRMGSSTGAKRVGGRLKVGG